MYLLIDNENRGYIEMNKENLEKRTLKLLVIEDNPEHLEDARRYFSSLSDVDVSYATTHSEARSRMVEFDSEQRKDVKRNIDGVISDIFFPEFVPENAKYLNATIYFIM